jgi:hypothetical protein
VCKRRGTRLGQGGPRRAASPLPERLRGRRDDTRVFLSAFDLLELDGVDWRGEPIEHRKASLAVLLRGATPGLQINEDICRARRYSPSLAAMFGTGQSAEPTDADRPESYVARGVNS